jgi:hypothetical protein
MSREDILKAADSAAAAWQVSGWNVPDSVEEIWF